MGIRYWNQARSDCRKFGSTKYEDYLEKCFLTLGLPCKRKQVFCFICYNMWTNDSNSYPHECRNCGTAYVESRMYAMPDIVIEDPERHGKAVIFVNGSVHDNEKVRARDKFQAKVFTKNNYRVFVLDNSEIDFLKHSNRCFLVLGIYRAMKDLTMYNRALLDEKEIPILK